MLHNASCFLSFNEGRSIASETLPPEWHAAVLDFNPRSKAAAVSPLWRIKRFGILPEQARDGDIGRDRVGRRPESRRTIPPR
jgi:hypothetical protein